jgi:peptidoglycan/LPS O-acetylase OafA/YrhL
LEILDWLRGFAALAVAWFHFTVGSGLFASSPLIAWSHYGWLGVEAFFVISGFVIPYAMFAGGYRGLQDAPAFILKRLARLEPPYVASIVIGLAILYAAAHAPGFRGQPPHVTPIQLLLHLGYLNVFTNQPWLNPVFWTLAVEFQFYISMVGLFYLIGSARPELRLAGLALMAVLALCVRTHQFVFPYLGLFALGAVAFHYRTGLVGRAGFAFLAAVLSILNMGMLGLPSALVGLATAALTAFANPPRIPALAWLGAISYSLYLLHVPIGGRVMNLAGRLPAEWHGAALLAAVAASLLAAWGFHRFVETPSQRWSGRIRYTDGVGIGSWRMIWTRRPRVPTRSAS